MKLGLLSFNTEHSMSIVDLARAAEERGFDSLWVPEHTHIPVPEDSGDPQTGMPKMPGGGYLEEEYRQMSDPFTSLAAAAAVTESLLLGTCICLVNQHHPINLAKQVATLDRISGGRFIFGVGAGWNVQEMNHHGVEFPDRWRQMRERLEAIRTIWRSEQAAFSGDYIQFEALWQYPKPLAETGPPVVLGTLDTRFGREQVARYGDGWLPLTFDIEQTMRSIEDVRKRMRGHGRAADTLEVSLLFIADEMQSADTLLQAVETGAQRAIMRLPRGDERVVLPALDEYARSIS